MAVGTDDDVTGSDESLLGQEGMLDAHITYLEVVLYFVLTGKAAHALCLLSRLDVLVRSEVVGNERDLFLIEDIRRTELRELPYGDRACDVVAKHH